jgi:hypothetical protein
MNEIQRFYPQKAVIEHSLDVFLIYKTRCIVKTLQVCERTNEWLPLKNVLFDKIQVFSEISIKYDKALKI